MLSPPPGRHIDVEGRRLHIQCTGDGLPTVVFDSALGASSLSWALVQPSVARLTRACSYDRAGFGWSDAGPLPRTAGRIADELVELLHRAGTPMPAVIVGHSFGGLVAQLFVSRYPDKVAGMVLIEPAIAEQWARPTPEQRAMIARGVRLCRYGASAARYGVANAIAALVDAGALGLARGLVSIVSRGGLRREDEGILAPIWKLPAETRGLLKQAWTQRKFFEALGSQIEMICESASEVLSEAPADYGDLPVVVLSSSTASAMRLRADARLASKSTRGRHLLIENTGHWIPLDAPHAVVEAVSALVLDIRSQGAHNGRHEENRVERSHCRRLSPYTEILDRAECKPEGGTAEGLDRTKSADDENGGGDA